ncbi:pPIWI-associating nuclease domain-containing protein [Streptacidiphilus cavernicola]|uniref:Predicted pPIWI-associating nuclease domain-containing protein n=1 Tax=Streptacidiphilus cavernicola TaxID=3342716 RepID=A0ABV6VWU6_9ACTN
MAVFVAGDDDGAECGTPTAENEAAAKPVPSGVADAVAKIIDSSRIYSDSYKSAISPLLAQEDLLGWGKIAAGLKTTLPPSSAFLAQEDLLGLGKLADDARKTMLPSSSIIAFMASLRSMDQLTGRRNAQYLQATTALSALVDATTVSAWRTSLQIENVLGEILKGPAFTLPSMVATEDLRKALGGFIHRQVYLTDWLAQIDTGRGLLSKASSRPLSQYQKYVSGLGDSPSRFKLDSSLHTGLGVNGLLGADALSSPVVLEDADLEAEVADRVEDLLTPQQAGRLDVLEDLRRVMAHVDGKVVEMLEGGWHVVRQAPPAAAEMAAQCAVEAIDRAIRAAAPDEEVEQWLPTSGRPGKEWRSENGRLTRAVRIRYIMRGYKDEAKMTCTVADNLIALQSQVTSRAQAIKHASAGDLQMARCLLSTAENVLTMLFVVPRT